MKKIDNTLVGKRIRLTKRQKPAWHEMYEWQRPIGSTGTVDTVDELPFDLGQHVHVDWDDGTIEALDPLAGDEFEVI